MGTTIPGVGPLIAAAFATLAPDPTTFRRGRDFATWLELTPRQHSSGGKRWLGSTTKMGERSLRQLLIIGANAVVTWRRRKGATPGTWLAGMLASKPAVEAAIATAWSNGQTEGQICKLKLVKRQMYGLESSTTSKRASSACLIRDHQNRVRAVM